MLQATLGLDEILRREITTDWYEGVAVIQAVCRAVPGISAPGTGFPSPRQISITATGEIELLGVTSSPDAVVAAGRLLGEMLHNDVPVRLRLIHSEAVATRPAFATLEALVEALAYFERPDSQQTLQKLYARASAARKRPGHADQALVEGQTRVPVPNAAPAELALEHQIHAQGQKRRSNPWYSVALGIVLVAVAATAFLAQGGGQHVVVFSGGDDPVEKSANPPSDGARKLGATKPAAGARTSRTSEMSSSARRPSNARPLAKQGNSRSTSSRQPLPAALEKAGLAPSPILLAGFAAATVFDETIAVQVADNEENDDKGVPIYSRVNGDVQPPVAIRPHLPSEPPAHIPAEHLMVLDLVVTDQGLVESVRLLTDPRTVMDFMMVSAAKAWIFAPATLDGLPVKYRHRIRFAMP
jgi:hypothetical protein